MGRNLALAAGAEGEAPRPMVPVLAVVVAPKILEQQASSHFVGWLPGRRWPTVGGEVPLCRRGWMPSAQHWHHRDDHHPRLSRRRRPYRNPSRHHRVASWTPAQMPPLARHFVSCDGRGWLTLQLVEVAVLVPLVPRERRQVQHYLTCQRTGTSFGSTGCGSQPRRAGWRQPAEPVAQVLMVATPCSR